MAETVYVLCALTSLACFVLLGRGYLRSRTRLLLWSSLCFLFLAANNILLFVDLVVLPTQVDLRVARDVTSVLGVSLLVFGLIWDSD